MNKRTAVFSWHRANSARIIEFAGWDMPLYYGTGSINEHHLVRRSCGLFDIGHMGRFILHCADPGALDEYERVLSSHVKKLPPGTGNYALLCNEDGGIIDDVFQFRLDDFTYLLVVNAANHHKDKEWIQAQCPNVHLSDITVDIGMIAVQGPRSFELLAKTGFAEKVQSLSERNKVSAGDIFTDGVFTRTGYTGEDGVELYAPNNVILRVWNKLLEQGEAYGIECAAAGLAARDSLRFEPGYALYGHELREDLTPGEAGLKWACKLRQDEPDFIGKTAILTLHQETEKKYLHKLYTIKMIDSAVPRKDMKVYGDKTGLPVSEIGWVCSGMFCPTLNGFYANVYLKGASKIGNKVYIGIRGKQKVAEIVKRPLYRVL